MNFKHIAMIVVAASAMLSQAAFAQSEPVVAGAGAGAATAGAIGALTAPVVIGGLVLITVASSTKTTTGTTGTR